MSLTIKQLNVVIGQYHILHNLNLHLKSDEIVAILGPKWVWENDSVTHDCWTPETTVWYYIIEQSTHTRHVV